MNGLLSDMCVYWMKGLLSDLCVYLMNGLLSDMCVLGSKRLKYQHVPVTDNSAVLEDNNHFDGKVLSIMIQV